MKDTKFERTQHEATGRHQGNLKRFLRGIQNDHEKDEREKQRARAEVERLNKAVGGPSTLSDPGQTQSVRRPASASTSQATVADRKRQMAQLAEMGIAVPDEYRGEMALAGDWQIVSQKPVNPEELINENPPLSIGVRKRKLEGQEEEEEEAGAALKRRGWGSTIKEYPSLEKPDLEALLAGTHRVKKEADVAVVKQEEFEQHAADDQVCYSSRSDGDALHTQGKVHVKQEDDAELPTLLPGHISDGAGNLGKDMSGAPEVVFKKRRSKNARQK